MGIMILLVRFYSSVSTFLCTTGLCRIPVQGGDFMKFNKLRGIFILFFSIILVGELIFFGCLTIRTEDLKRQYEEQSILLSSIQADQTSPSETVSFPSSDELKKQISDLQEEIAVLQKQANENKSTLEQKQQELNELQSQLSQ